MMLLLMLLATQENMVILLNFNNDSHQNVELEKLQLVHYIYIIAGFSNSDSPCCSFGRIRPALTCVPASVLCKDRSKYVFWDEYHPSDKANELIANELIKKFGFLRVNQSGAPSPSPAPESDPDPTPAPAVDPSPSPLIAPSPN